VAALKLDIEIEQGATFRREFTCTDASTGLPFSLVGGAPTAKLYNRTTGAQVAVFGCSVSTNKLLIELTYSQTLTLTPSTEFTHRYEAEVLIGTIVYRIANGLAMISQK
jgi:hypothetical protein